MTACVNKKHSRRVAAAVSASLVGALTLGAAPAVVFATEAPEAAVEQESADDVRAFENGSVTGQTGFSSDANGLYLVADGSNMIDDVKATQITTGNKQVIDLTTQVVARDYTVEVVTVNEDGTYGAATNEVVNPGTYAYKITAIDGTYKGGVLYHTFTVKPATLVNLGVYEINPADATQLNDDKFVFNGSVLDLGIKSGSAALTEGVDYEVKFIPADMGPDNEGVEVKNVGKYFAVVTGLGKYAGQRVTVNQTINVQPFYLGNADVSIYCDPVVDSDLFPVHPTTVVYHDTVHDTYTYLDTSLVKLDITNTGTQNQVFDKIGQYTVTALPVNSDDGNVTGEKTGVTIDKYDHAANIEYDDKAFPETFSTDLSAARPTHFDVWSVKAYDAESDKQLAQADVTTYVFDAAGECVYWFNGSHHGDHTWKRTPGDYTVKVVAGASDHSAAATAICKVHIIYGTIDADASVYFNYTDADGKVSAVTSLEVVYDGTDVMDDITPVVKNADGTEVSYDVTITDAEGNEVKEIVNAGTYTVTVTVPGYDLTGVNTLPITVAKKSFKDVVTLATTSFDAENANYKYLPWRKGGVPVSDLIIDADVTKNFTVTIMKDGQKVDEVTDEGEYTIHFEPKTNSVTANYETPADLEVVCVKDATSGGAYDHTLFTDVTWRDYFADAVAAVNGKTYMTGYKGTQLFGALGNLSRGQVACILYNMAGGESLKFEGSYSDLWGYQTGFGDVDGNAYYAKAIAWAKQAGVVNGYADGTFHPDQAVTRQEFACMLANYAKKYDANYEAASADALDKMSDADQVAEFAKESVAWAVENGIIGNSGYVAASSNIIRADAACMVYNYCIAE